MKDKEIIGIVNGASTYALHSLLSAIAIHNSKLTRQERAEREERRRLIAEMEMRKAKVLKNICPNCEGKLARGKKDKKNDYQRLWICGNCHSQYNNNGDLFTA